MSHSTFLQLDIEKLEDSNEQKDTWSFYVNRDSMLKVSFSEPLTAREALSMFDNMDYEDIIDEEDIAIIEVIDIV